MTVVPDSGLEATREGVAIFDANGTALGCSRRMCELLSLEGDGLGGIVRLLEEHREVRAVLTGEGARAELEAGGRRLAFSSERAGRVLLLRAHDLGEEQELAARLLTASRHEAVGRLCDGMAHDARNPLNAIVLNVEVLGERLKHAGPDVRAGVEKYLKAIREQVARTDAIIRHFVAFARPERIAERSGEIDLAQLVSQVVEACRHDARKRNVRIDAKLSAVPVSASTPELAHAILQLVLHGIDSNNGGTLQIALERQGTDAVLHLTEELSAAAANETPPGMDERTPPRAPLRDVARLVGRLHGNLSSSPEGRGSEVVVRLPALARPQ